MKNQVQPEVGQLEVTVLPELPAEVQLLPLLQPQPPLLILFTIPMPLHSNLTMKDSLQMGEFQATMRMTLRMPHLLLGVKPMFSI